MKNIEFKIEYEKLFFDDIMYVFKTIKNTSKKFYSIDENWHKTEKYVEFLKENNIEINNEDFLRAIPIIQKIISRGLTYEIKSFEQGSIKIKGLFVISDSALIPILSAVNLPVGITVSIITGLALLYYNENEEEYDMKINRLKENWKRTSKKPDRKKRRIEYQMIKEK